MSNPTQPDVLDRMIARLEEANARSYNGQSRVDEPLKSDHDDHHELPSPPDAPKRRLRWARAWITAIVPMVIIASVYVTIFASASSYVDTAKVKIVRWAVRRASQTPPQGAVPVPQISREIEPRLQEMTGELAELQQQIEQLKASQDLASRGSAETVAQFKIDREQMMRDSANLADQLRVTQERLSATQAQLAEIVSAEATNNPGRKFLRRRRVSALAQRARVRSSVR